MSNRPVERLLNLLEVRRASGQPAQCSVVGSPPCSPKAKKRKHARTTVGYTDPEVAGMGTDRGVRFGDRQSALSSEVGLALSSRPPHMALCRSADPIPDASGLLPEGSTRHSAPRQTMRIGRCRA
jgi:hypothetical protein